MRRRVLSQDVIQFACGAQRPVRPLAPESQTKKQMNKDEGVALMLVDTSDEKSVKLPENETKADKASVTRVKKRRRKAAAEEPPADKSDSVDTST